MVRPVRLEEILPYGALFREERTTVVCQVGGFLDSKLSALVHSILGDQVTSRTRQEHFETQRVRPFEDQAGRESKVNADRKS